MAYEEPLFRSHREALTFAYNFSHGTMKPSALTTMMGGPKRAGRGLGGLDGAAQAGMIKAEVSKLPPVQAACVAARFSPKQLKCACRSPCCTGSKPNPEYLVALTTIAAIAKNSLHGLTKDVRLRQGIAQRYFGETFSLVDLGNRCGVNRDTASVHANKMMAFLKAQEELGLAEMETRLKLAGVVA